MTQSKTLVSRHPYRTRAIIKRMENLEQSHETLRADVNSMKKQMAAMMEALNVIKSKLESTNSLTEEGISSYLRAPRQDEVQAQNVDT